MLITEKQIRIVQHIAFMASLQTIASYPGLLQAFRITTISSMLFISGSLWSSVPAPSAQLNMLGLSFCLSTWVIPNILMVPPHLQTRQFTATVTKGARYLMRASRTMMVSLLLNTWLTAIHPDPLVSADWTTWATMCCVLFAAAPYEIYFIFPINDAVMSLNRQVEKDKRALSNDQETELANNLNRWAFRNYGRVALPLIAGILGMCHI